MIKSIFPNIIRTSRNIKKVFDSSLENFSLFHSNIYKPNKDTIVVSNVFIGSIDGFHQNHYVSTFTTPTINNKAVKKIILPKDIDPEISNKIKDKISQANIDCSKEATGKILDRLASPEAKKEMEELCKDQKRLREVLSQVISMGPERNNPY